MKKIIVIDNFNYGSAGPRKFLGGIEKYTYNLATVLDKMTDVDVTLVQAVAQGHTPQQASYNLNNVKQIFIPLGNRYEYIQSVDPDNKKSAMYRWNKETKEFVNNLFKSNNYDLCINSHKNNISKLAVEAGIPTIFPLHGSTSQCGGMSGTIRSGHVGCGIDYGSDIFRFGYASDYVIKDFNVYCNKQFDYTITDKQKEWWPVGLTSYSGPVFEDDDYAIIVCRADTTKAPHIAVKNAIAAGTKVKLYTSTANENEEKYFEQRIKPLMDNPLVEVHLKADHSDIMVAIGKARLMIMPSRVETFGIAGLEAMERGVPIVYQINEKMECAPQDAIVDPAIKHIVYSSPNKVELIDRIRTLKLELRDRQLIADITRTRFSTESWINNIERVLKTFQKNTQKMLF